MQPIAGNLCASSADVETATRALPDLGAECWPRADCWREKIRVARALRNRHPTDLLAHRLLVTTAVWAGDSHHELRPVRAQLTREYAELSKRFPENPAYPYLLGRLEENRPRARALFERALLLDATFPWAHERMVRVLSRKPLEKSDAVARNHFEAFVRSCPARKSDSLSLLADLRDRGAWEVHAPTLREAVSRSPGSFDDWRQLWELEFQLAQPSEYGKLREKLRVEAEDIRRMERRSDRKWLAALQKAYGMLGDEGAKTAIEDARMAAFPCATETTDILLERQRRELGPWPSGGAALQAWLAKAIAGLETFVARCPDEMLLRQIELSYLSQWNGAPVERVEAAADKVLTLPDDAMSGRVAEIYLEKGIRLNRVPALLDADERESEDQWRRYQAVGLPPEDMRDLEGFHRSELFRRLALRTRLALARRDAREVSRRLSALATAVAAIEKAAATSGDRQMVAYTEAQLWRLRGEAAALGSKDAEALDHFARSLEKNPREEKVEDLARAAYSRLHGTADGFAKWRRSVEQAARTASDEVTRAVRRPLPEFRIVDLSGRTWTAADLRGKAVLINFWATWCGPCLGELPHVQKLHERLAGSRDRRVITVSIDENPGLIEPFLRREKYTFPVLIGGPGAYGKWTPEGIPQSYVIDPSGTIVREQLGFSGDGARWLSDIERDLRDAATPSPRVTEGKS